MPAWVVNDLRHYLHLFDLNLQYRLRPSRQATWRYLSQKKPLRLHLGCGGIYLDGWINIDAYERVSRGHRVDFRIDCRFLKDWPDNCCIFVYSHHFFEHLHRDYELLPLLCNLHRILQSGGVIRAAVPDLEKYLNRYNDKSIRRLDAGREVNAIFYNHQHRYMYDFCLLKDLLEGAGFRNVTRKNCGESVSPDLLVEKSSGDDNMTLYVEALK